MKKNELILSVRDLNIKFNLRGKILHAIRGIDLDVYHGEVLAIVGESGSGKSVFTKSFMGLLDSNGSITSGTIDYFGADDHQPIRLSELKKEKDWLKVTAAKWLNRKFKLELTAIEMDGISSVIRIGGKSKIYSSTMMRSTLSPTFCISPKASVYLGIGGNWLRSIRISDRDFGGFLDSFREDGHDFGVSLRVTAGFNWSF